MQGVGDNLGFEALTLNMTGGSTIAIEPFRLFTAAESALTKALTLAEQLRMKPRIARLHHSWARLDTALGNVTAAASHHEIASDLSRTLNLVPHWQEQRSSA